MIPVIYIVFGALPLYVQVYRFIFSTKEFDNDPYLILASLNLDFNELFPIC